MRDRLAMTPCAAFLAAPLLLLAMPAQAASCRVSPQDVHFGQYDPTSASPTETVGNITITCDVQTAFEIALGPGTGTYAARTMTSGANAMTYNLYSDPQRTIVWGDGGGGSNTVSAATVEHDFPVYGRATARQNLPAGAYTDIVTITVTY